MTARSMDAAALTVALAGADSDAVAAAFEPAARDGLRARVRALRPVGTREQRARVLASAGLRLLGAPREGASDVVGARFVAAWLRSLGPLDRGAFVRGLGAAPLAALRAALPSAPEFDAARRSTATHLVGVVHRTLGQAPTLAGWSALLGALALRGPLADAGLLRAARALRMGPRAPACLALADELCAR